MPPLPSSASTWAEAFVRTGGRRREGRLSRGTVSLGGVSRVAHANEPVIRGDRELFRFAEIWPAAGHPHAVLPPSPDELALTGAPVEDVSQA